MIRAATIHDEDRVVEIYNQAIAAGFQTAFTEPFDGASGHNWFVRQLSVQHPMVVYTIDNQVVGWGNITPYRQGRAALRYTVELSYFVHQQYLHRGIGAHLLKWMLEESVRLGYKTVLAVILNKNVASIRLAEKFGLEQWAFLPAIADFDGVECDHVYYGKKL